MIKSFKDDETRKIFERHRSLKLEQGMQRVANRKLRMLHNSHTLKDLSAPPSNRLEKLKGDREGQYSIRINDQYRICFEWNDGDAFQVEITDYH
jgi:proteic killer suppression protein